MLRFLVDLRQALFAENQRLQVLKYEVLELGFRERRNPKPFDLWQRFGLEAGLLRGRGGLEDWQEVLPGIAALRQIPRDRRLGMRPHVFSCCIPVGLL